MFLVSLKDVTVQLGSRVVLDGVNLEIQPDERLGLVGENGAGKSTLLAIIAGELKPDSGVIRIASDVALARQSVESPAESDAIDPELVARFHADISEQDANTLSGGESTRRKLAHAFGEHAPITLLDEPTANLDTEGCEQLERMLLAMSGAFILVSHDRALLDSVCDGILALENGKLRRYAGGWTEYKQIREDQRAREIFEYEQYRAEERRLKSVIQGMKEARDQVKTTPSRMGNSEARLHKRGSTGVQKHLDHIRKGLESRVEHLDKKSRPTIETKLRMSENLPKNCQGIISETALTISRITLYGGNKLLLEHADALIPARGVTALVGPNGCGKSTLLRTIFSGNDAIRPANGLRLGYFSQDALETLDSRSTLLENVMRDSAYPQSVARTVLARLGLTEGDMNKSASALSGGERAKCLLVSLLLAPSNFLLLDEPGNYLDIYAMDALESLLTSYPHGILMVSHDRRLIDCAANRIIRIKDHRIIVDR